MSSLTITNNFTNSTTADAEEVDTNFSDVKSFVDSHLLHKETDALSNGAWISNAARVAKFSAAGDEGKKFHFGTQNSVTTDASGFATITHGAGFTPAAVICWWDGNGLGGFNGAISGTDTMTATTFRIRIANADARTLDISWLAIS